MVYNVLHTQKGPSLFWDVRSMVQFSWRAEGWGLKPIATADPEVCSASESTPLGQLRSHPFQENRPWTFFFRWGQTAQADSVAQDLVEDGTPH